MHIIGQQCYHLWKKNKVSKVALIVETRRYKALPFVLKNVMQNLSDEWLLQIFHGNKNLDYIKNFVEKDEFLTKIKNKITFTNLNIDEISADDSSLEIRLTEKFWNDVIGDTVLYFECDSMLCPTSKYKVDDFIHFDYIGGYWGTEKYPLDEEYPVVMNGGLSLRKKDYMLNIIKTNLKPYLDRGDNPCEDYFVSSQIRGERPTSKEVRNFSIDCGCIEPLDMKAPFGVHKPWGIGKHGHGQYYDKIKELCPEIEELKSLQEEIQWWEE